MLVPIGIMIVSAVEETIYIAMFDQHFSLEFTWQKLLTSAVLFAVYAITVFKAVKSKLWLVIASSALMIVEVGKLIFPQLSFAYVVDANIYIADFLSALLLYAAFLFIAFSIAYHQRKDNPL
jgi:hypothetical protein